MTVLQYRQKQKQQENALIKIVCAKPKTFLAFFMKWKRNAEFPDMRKYMKSLYDKYHPWPTFEEILAIGVFILII